jgi:hypothetical protein
MLTRRNFAKLSSDCQNIMGHMVERSRQKHFGLLLRSTE